MAAMPSLYRRVLPSPPAVDFSSPEGKRLFAEALAAGTMEGFFSLVSCFQTQSEPAFCGLASLAVVLNALSIDPGRRWKGPWRWFDESMLDCCEPLDKVKAQGISFGKVACLAHCSGADVQSFRANRATIHDLRRHLIRCASSRDCHLIASYNRKPFKQTGTGHFSPIGGYHAGQDMALILDVARFKYPPHWVPLPLLWEAMNTTDESTGLLRGFMLISRHTAAPSSLYTVSCRDESWKSMAKYCTEDLPNLLKAENLDNVPTLLSRLIDSLPANAGALIKWVVEVRRKEEGGPSLSKEEKERLSLKESVLQQVRDTKLFMVVHDLQCANTQCCKCSSSSEEDSITRIAAAVCCQGAAMLSGNLASSDGFCCRETCFKCVQANADGHKTVISGSVISEGNEQGVDMLLPMSPHSTSSCNSNLSDEIMKFPSSADVLSVLLLALHPRTWLGIKDERLKAEFQTLVSTDDLPDVLKREILHLRRQLCYLNSCKEEGYEDYVPPSPSSLC
ncbi:glutathione gamma-glutamylcysteinyltransferase 1-like isoform X2 [Phragmites australis]|uniref:glutathione gamma-glutamylcysteinyltransferase 1-like isoform X2 n=1 Tax=Phragmites australis TaxID=29695 RepID=UPI002D79B777|nr:glutathione gamma-glutamylcysteinyltransferase 1-like isoform X2 [Phragmites australis]